MTDPLELGTSRPAAIRRFLQNERSLRSKSKLDDFEAVLQEYVHLGHAETVPTTDLAQPVTMCYYLPIHGVVKKFSTKTKLRAMFDASAKTSTGISLNDQLLPGPNLYPLLTSVLTAFRCHKIAITADISKMFRDVELDPDKRNYHRFLMRKSTSEIIDYRMQCLTFGVKFSPFLSTMVLLEHADRHSKFHPQASSIVKSAFYVDDCLTGVSTMEEAAHIREQLCELLNLCGMTLRKWRSNSAELLSTVSEELQEAADLQLTDPLASSKTLGNHWNVATDVFYLPVPTVSPDITATKRNLASIAAQVFDVLGLYSPAMVVIKILLQRLWKQGLNWDEPAPPDISESWSNWLQQLPVIASHPVSRHLSPHSQAIVSRQIHAFADVSTSAYGTVIYLRVLHEDSSVSVRLVTSKAKVASVKPSTVPRLELMAAHLLARLVTVVLRDLQLTPEDVYAWTDSSIVLAWHRGFSTRLKGSPPIEYELFKKGSQARDGDMSVPMIILPI